VKVDSREGGNDKLVWTPAREWQV